MLDDPGLNREIASYIAAGAALAAERVAQLLGRIEAADDDYIRQRAMDVRLPPGGEHPGRAAPTLRLETPSILVSEYIYPSDIVSIGAGWPAPRAASRATPPSSPAPWASPRRRRGRAGFLSQNSAAGAVLDADNGRLILEPDEAVRKDAQRRIVGASILKKRLAALGAAGPCRTKDGAHVALMAELLRPRGRAGTGHAGGRGGRGPFAQRVLHHGGAHPQRGGAVLFYSAACRRPAASR